jgi:hypothetical protein
MTEWQPNSSNTANFQLVDTSNDPVTGLGTAFMFDVMFPGTSVFIDGTGTKSEIGRGWYRYVSPPSESVTVGEFSVTASGAGTTQQNLVYQVGDATAGFGSTLHTVNVDIGGTPQDGVEVWITSDEAGTKLVAGTLTTNAQGNANFWLDSGTYYVWVQHSAGNFTNPTTITV